MKGPCGVQRPSPAHRPPPPCGWLMTHGWTAPAEGDARAAGPGRRPSPAPSPRARPPRALGRRPAADHSRPLLPLSWGSPQPAARTGSPAVGSAHREPTQRRDGGSGWPHTRSPSNAATRPAPCPDSHAAPGPGGRLTRCDGDDPATPSRKGPARSFLGSRGPEGTASLPGGPGTLGRGRRWHFTGRLQPGSSS